MENKESKQEYDLSKIYTYKEFPDIVVVAIIAVILHSGVLLKISSF